MKTLSHHILAIMLVGLPVLAAPGDAPPCTPYMDSVHWTGEYDVLYYANAVHVVDDLAYVADDGLGLRIIDVSDPALPVLAGGLEFGAGAEDLVVEEPLIYLATGPGGLHVVDVADAQAPVVVGNLVLPGAAVSLVKRGDLVYLSCGPGGLQIVDVSDPAAPLLVGGLSVGPFMRDVALADSVAFVGYVEAGVNTVRAIDVADPGAPVLLGAVTTPSRPNGITLADGLAYVVCGDPDRSGDGHLQVLDIADPAAPVAGAVLPQPPGATEALVDGNALWTCGALDGDDNYGYLHAFDRTDPTLPVFTGEIVLRHWGEGISLVNGQLCVAAGYYPGPDFFHQGSLQIVAKPSLETTPHLPAFELTYVNGLSIDDDLAHVSGGSGGLRVVDVFDPAAPQVIGSVDSPGYAYDVDLADGFAYLADGFNGLQIVDVTDPYLPVLRGAAGSTETRLVDVAGGLAGVASIPLGGSTGWFELVDISDPDLPMAGGGLAFTQNITGLALDESHAFLAVNDGSVKVVELSFPATPAVVAERALPGRPQAMDRAGDYLYLAGYPDVNQGCLWIVDVTDPLLPLLVAEVPAPATATDVAVGDSLLYLACGPAGTAVYDLAIPHVPALIGVLTGESGPLAATSTAAYVASANHGLQIGGLPCGGVSSVGPSAAPLAAIGPRAHPNPFNPQATITFTMDRTERAEIAVYDLSGRRIAVLADRVLESGERTVQWDGRDDAGRNAPSGMYILRLTTAHRVLGGKATLLR